MSQFSESLKAVRKKSGKKQREAAEYIGLNIRTYQYYEGGQNEPAIPMLIKLADFFQVSIDELVGREWTGQPPKFCIHCGRGLPEGIRWEMFCPWCGEKIQL